MSAPAVRATTLATDPVRLTCCELLLRDGIQGWPQTLATTDKLRLLDAIDKAGVPEIDLTSFVPVHAVPQFADAEQVLAGFAGAARIRVLTVNRRGTERVIEAHRQIRPIAVCGMPFSASEEHNKANLRCDHATHRGRIAEMVELLGAAGIEPMVCVATAWGCPIIGRVPEAEVLKHVDWLHGIGVRSIMLGDTVGAADPARVSRLFTRLLGDFPDVGFIAHFHDNRGCGIANTLAAIAAGVRSVDSCLGGVGGEPDYVDQGDVGESGNVVTEDLVNLFVELGFSTGIDIEYLLAAGACAEAVLGRRLFSKVQRAGIFGRR